MTAAFRVTCCEHNPCPTRPTKRLRRFQEQPWRCPDCHQFWVTEWRSLWTSGGDLGEYSWTRVWPGEAPTTHPTAAASDRDTEEN